VMVSPVATPQDAQEAESPSAGASTLGCAVKGKGGVANKVSSRMSSERKEDCKVSRQPDVAVKR